MNITFSRAYWSLLSVLRFILATIVCVGHLKVFASLNGPLKIMAELGGKASVVCFLFISGLSVGYSFFSSDQGFLKRRIVRIYPLYFIAVLFAILLQWTIPTPFRTYGQTFVTAGSLTSIGNLLLLQGIFCIPITFNGPLWSLSVEFFLYLAAPLFARFSYLINVLLCILSIAVFYLTYDKLKVLFGLPIMQYMWSWLVGFMIAKSKKIQFFSAVIIIGGCIVASKLFTKVEPLAYLVMLVSSIGIFVLPTKSWVKSFPFEKITTFLGDISYPLYVFHFPSALLLYFLGIRNAWAFLSVIYLISILFFYVFDIYLKARFWKPLFNYLFQFIPRPLKYLF